MLVHGRGLLAGAVLVVFLAGCGTDAEPLRHRVARENDAETVDDPPAEPPAETASETTPATEPETPSVQPPAGQGEIKDAGEGKSVDVAEPVVVEDVSAASTSISIGLTEFKSDAIVATTNKSEDQSAHATPTVDAAKQEADNTTGKTAAKETQEAAVTSVIQPLGRDVVDADKNTTTAVTKAAEVSTAAGAQNQTTSSVPVPVQAGVFLTFTSTLLVAVIV